MDLKILAHLAEYHGRRIHAGLHYALFQQSGDVTALDQAIAWERRAIAAWQDLVGAAGDVYADNLALGLPESKDRERPANDLSGTGGMNSEIALGLRGWNGRGTRSGRKSGKSWRALSSAVDPSSRVTSVGATPRFQFARANGYYELKFTISDSTGEYGPMWIEANGADRTDVFGGKDTIERTLSTRVRDGKLNVMFASESSGRWTARKLVVSRGGPQIAHVPLRFLDPGEDAVLRATVAGPDEIRSVRVWYGDASRGFRSADAEGAGAFRFQVRIPAPADGTRLLYPSRRWKGRIVT